MGENAVVERGNVPDQGKADGQQAPVNPGIPFNTKRGYRGAGTPAKRYMKSRQIYSGQLVTAMLESLPKEFRDAYISLFSRQPDDVVMKTVIVHELKRRLAEYHLIDKKMRKQYGMSFSEFKKQDIVGKKGRSFQAEEDYCDWELATDGIHTVQAKLKELEKYL